MADQHSKAFLNWYKQLQRKAEEVDSGWLISSDLAQHKSSYLKGFSPDQELGELQELAQWQGCGCGA